MLWNQKKVYGRWQIQGEKQTFDDYDEFYAAYRKMKEQVDAANRGLPGLLWSVGWREEQKPKQIKPPQRPNFKPLPAPIPDLKPLNL